MNKRFSLLTLLLVMIGGILYSQVVTQTFTTNGSFTIPSGVTQITVECWGGGGSGGGSTSDNNGGGGGGGGAYAKSILTVTPGEIYPLTIGSGGTTSTGSGTIGGTTTFNTDVVIAVGGSGGGSNSGGSGGTGGASTSCVGDDVFSGGNGAAGNGGTSGGGGGAGGSTENGGSASGLTAGTGGAIGGGSGGFGRTDAGNGNIGSNYGGGGSGGRKGGILTSSRNGGAGASGAVLITFTLPSCTSNPNPSGNVTSTLSSGCSGTSITITATNVSTDYGIEYKWLKSIDNGANWVDVGTYAAVPVTGTITLTQTPTVTTKYKLETRCTLDGNLTSYSNETEFSVTCWTSATNNTVTNCGGVFYDSGGSSADYAANQTYTYTFYPSNVGEKARLIFSQFATENNYDGMMIYNGNNSSAPLISSGLGVGSDATTCPAGSWRGTVSPGTVTSSSIDGSLTIVFRSDASTNAAGWTANLSCVNVPVTPETPTSNSPNCNSVTITRNDIPPIGEIWYWQTTANGINTDSSDETYTVTNSGTYYLRSYKLDNNEWSLPASITVTVDVIPSIASTPVPSNMATGICYAGDSKITTISWAPVSGAISYDVFFDANLLPSTLTSNVASNSFTLPADLLPSTTYHWKVIPKNACGEPTDCLEWSFTTSPLPCSCAPGTVDCTYENITKVVFAGINNNNNSCSPNGYGNYTNLPPAQVLKGGTYPISVTLNCDGTEYVGLWIDFDKNGIFDASEYAAIGSTSVDGTILTQNISIPISAESGITKMRIRQNYDVNIINTESCSSTAIYGEVEDYYVNICVAPTKPEIPISNSPNCEMVTISQSGIPIVGETWYWQSSSVGTSIENNVTQYDVFQSGRYYIRSINECGYWSEADSIDVNVFLNSVAATSIDGNVYALVGESLDLEVVGGILGEGAQWRWYSDNCGVSTPIGEGSVITVSPNATTNNYFVRAEGLCDTTICIQHTIETYQLSGGVCDVIYVSSNGNDNFAGTIDFPVKSLYRALQLVSTDRKHVMIQAADFNETKRANLPSDVFIDGGYEIINGVWVKTNSVQTQINFLDNSIGSNSTVTNIDDYIRNLIGISSNGASGWTLQDLNINTSNVTGNSIDGNGSNNYALWINGSSDYNIVRCNIVSGNASNGLDGIIPTGYATIGGIGGNGGVAGENSGLFGTDGETALNGAAGGSGNLGGAGCSGGCRASNGVLGSNGSDGISYTSGDRPISIIENSIYYVPVSKTDGQSGGGGGAGGGGGGSASYNLGICSAQAGGKGGNGGRGGFGGYGGHAGGGSFGIWMYNSNTNSYITNSNIISGLPGIGGLGTEGVIGENGQNGIAGGSGSGLCSSSNGGGAGGSGGKGGNGGRGRDGANGINADIVNDGFTSTSTYSFSITPKIEVYHSANKHCRNSEIILIKESGSSAWDFGSDLLFINDINIMTSSYTNSSDSILVYSPYQNYIYNLVSPIDYSKFIRTTSDERLLPIITINPTTICQNTGSINFSSTTWGSEEEYEWIIFQGNSNTPILTSTTNPPIFDLSNLAGGTYQVRYRVKESCCGWSIPVYSEFVINPAPAPITVNGGGTVCMSSTTLIAEGGTGGIIYWQGTESNGTSTSDGNTNQAITSNGTYYFRAVSNLGCWNDETEVQVTLNTPPTSVTVSGGTTQCGGTVTLLATGGVGGTIYWQNTTSSGTNIDNPATEFIVSQSGTYYFRSQSIDGCWGSEGSAIVVINSVPSDVTVTGGGTFCNPTVSLSATGGTGGTMYWQNTTSNGTSITNQVSTFEVTSNGTYYFRSKSVEGCWSNQGSANVVINPIPTNLNINTLTHHSAMLSWTENGSATLWNIEWGLAGFTIGNGNLIQNVSQNPYLLDGLAPNTSYDFYVRSVCSISDIGAWSTKKNFTTLVNSINESNKDSFLIWANNNILQVQIPENDDLKAIEIFDIQGRLILTSKSKTTSLEYLPASIYVVRVTTNNQIRVEKVRLL